MPKNDGTRLELAKKLLRVNDQPSLGEEMAREWIEQGEATWEELEEVDEVSANRMENLTRWMIIFLGDNVLTAALIEDGNHPVWTDFVNAAIDTREEMRPLIEELQKRYS